MRLIHFSVIALLASVVFSARTQAEPDKAFKGRVTHTENSPPGGKGVGVATRSIPELNGVRGGAQGCPFVDDIMYANGKSFYSRPDINDRGSLWERSLMQAVWQLWYEECCTKNPSTIIKLGSNAVDGYWSKDKSKAGFHRPIVHDPQIPVPESNKGCMIWTPYADSYIYVQGDIKLAVRISKSGAVTAKVIQSTLPAERNLAMLANFEQCSGHPAFTIPPGWHGDVVDLTIKLDASRRPGPLVSQP